MTFTGTCSQFGGPHDTGVGPREHLALYDFDDLEHAPLGLFLPEQPEGTTGTARRLNPDAMYCAMRWAYTPNQVNQLRHAVTSLGRNLPVCTPRGILRYNGPIIEVKANGHTVLCYAVDWGPNERTGRLIDLSPAAMTKLGVKTDDVVKVTILKSGNEKAES